MRITRLIAAAVAALVMSAVGIGLAAAPAGAHAMLISSNPTDQARLDRAPQQVVLEFNEDVSAGLGAVRVLAANGSRVDDGVPVVSDGVITTTLRSGLGDGAYVVAWRVLSADSHPIHGALTFTVGDVRAADDEAVAALVGDGDDTGYEVLGTIVRGFGYLGALLAAGLSVFLVLAHDGGAEARTLRRLARASAGLAVVGVLVALPVRAALATGAGISSVTEPGVARQVLGDGVGWSTVLVVVGMIGLVFDRGTRRAVTLGAGAVGVGAFALAGHASTTEPVWLAMTSTGAHAVAGAIWFGGLVGLGWVLHARRTQYASAGPVVARFSGIAATAVVGVAIAGTIIGWQEVRSLHGLTSTSYGRLLLAKVAIVACVVTIGGWNRFRLVPAMQRAPKAAGSRLRRTVRTEAGLLLAAVGLTAVLVNVTPARADAGAGSVFSATIELGDDTVDLVVDPARAGTNAVHLYLLDEAGRLQAPESLTLRFSLPAADVGPIEREPFAAGPGHWTVDTNDLSIAGTWTIEVVVRTSKFDQSTATVDVPVKP